MSELKRSILKLNLKRLFSVVAVLCFSSVLWAAPIGENSISFEESSDEMKVITDFGSSLSEVTNTNKKQTPLSKVPYKQQKPGVRPPKCRYGYSKNLGRCKTKKEKNRKKNRRGAKSISCGSAPVCGKFNAALSKCGCQLGPPRITRQQRGGRSCHNSGRAIDVMKIVCNGTAYNAYSARYKKWHRCMTSKKKNNRGTYSGNGLISLFRQAHKRHHGDTHAHYDHAHFSIGCNGGYY